MVAYKCNRCGKLYEKYEDSIFYVTKEIYQQDLCPQCTKSLEKWWESGKEQNNDTGRSN